MKNIATEEDNDNAAQEMLKAAFDSLSEGENLTKDMDMLVVAKRIVKAISAAGEAKKAAERALKIINKGDYASIDAECCHVVASAFCLVVNEIEYSRNMSPFSVGSVPFLAFAKGMLAAKYAEDATNVLFDSDSSFEYVSDGARLLVKNEKIYTYTT